MLLNLIAKNILIILLQQMKILQITHANLVWKIEKDTIKTVFTKNLNKIFEVRQIILKKQKNAKKTKKYGQVEITQIQKRSKKNKESIFQISNIPAISIHSNIFQ